MRFAILGIKRHPVFIEVDALSVEDIPVLNIHYYYLLKALFI